MTRLARWASRSLTTAQLLLVVISAQLLVTCNSASAADLSQRAIDPTNKPFDPDHQTPMSYQDDTYRLSLVKSGDTLEVAVYVYGKLRSRMELPVEIVQVDAIQRVQSGKAVILGQLNGDVQSVAVLDLDKGQVADAFLAYQPALSPDGRYVAFVKWFPPRYAGGVTHEYLLYDLSRDPRANRAQTVSLDNFQDVGTPVYPLGSANAADDNVDVPRGHTLSSDNFYWRKDSKTVVFADQDGGDRNRSRLSIVKIDLTRETPSVDTAHISTAGYCPAAKQGACALEVSGVRFERGGISLRINRAGADAVLLRLGNDEFK
jgi:hypothetical protein